MIRMCNERSSAWWECDNCGYEWSAACGDDEVPEVCECGGKVNEISADRLRLDKELIVHSR
jgi:rubredoxin